MWSRRYCARVPVGAIHRPNNLLTHPDYAAGIYCAPVSGMHRALSRPIDRPCGSVDTGNGGTLVGWDGRDGDCRPQPNASVCMAPRGLGAAPMAFVSPRGLSAYYIPVLGYAIFLAVTLVRGRELAARVLRLRPAMVFASQAILFVSLVVGMWRWQLSTERSFPDHWTDLQRIESAAAQFRSHREWFKPRASLLILNDPFGEYEWATTFIAAVVGNDRSVTIQKRKQDQPLPSPEQMAQFSTVIAYEDGRYFEVERTAGHR